MTPQKLRFSSTMQFIAAGLFALSFIVRTVALGLDALGLVFALIAVMTLVAGVLIRRRAAEMEAQDQ